MARNIKPFWQEQKDFIKELADINGIEFDPEKYQDETHSYGMFHKRYMQSDAALYIGEELGRIRDSGKEIYYPWRTDNLYVGFNGKRYSQSPWLFVPITRISHKVKDKDLISAVSFHNSDGPERYIDGTDESREGLMLVCKDCQYEWKHRCGKTLNGVQPANPDDIVVVTKEDGSSIKTFKCPVCGSLKVFKEGKFYWD